jgi:hypothetical protein
MVFRRVFLVLLLPQAAMGGFNTRVYIADVCGLLRLRPFVPGSYGHCFPRPRVDNAYRFEGNPRVHSSGDPGSLPQSMGEAGCIVRW